MSLKDRVKRIEDRRGWRTVVIVVDLTEEVPTIDGRPVTREEAVAFALRDHHGCIIVLHDDQSDRRIPGAIHIQRSYGHGVLLPEN